MCLRTRTTSLRPSYWSGLEKTQLVKEGKIKKEKPLPPISEEEIPFDLPDGWMWCRLGEVCSKLTDGSHNPPPARSTGYPVISAKNVKAGKVVFTASDRFADHAGFLKENPRTNITQGDIVLGIIGGSIGNVGIFDHDAKVIAQRSIAIINTLYVNEFVYCFIQSPGMQNFFGKKSSGTAQGGIYLGELKLIPLPLPPLHEQKLIITKVNKLMALCDELEAAEKELDTLESQFAEYLPKSILQAAVQGKLVPQNIHDEPADKLLERIRAEKAKLVKSDKLKKEKPLPPIIEDEILYDLPDGWAWCRLGELCNYGATNSVTPDQIGKNAWLLELEDIEKETGKLLQRETFCSRNSKSTKHVFIKGNILYSKLRPYLNKVLIAPESGYCTSEILPLDFLEVNNEYMLWFLRNPQFINYTNACSYGVKMPRLGTEDGKMAVVSLPPLAEQQRIVAKVNELMSLCDALKAAHETPVGAPIAATVIPFPHQEEESEMLMAARGAMPNVPSKALQDARNRLFED